MDVNIKIMVIGNNLTRAQKLVLIMFGFTWLGWNGLQLGKITTLFVSAYHCLTMFISVSLFACIQYLHFVIDGCVISLSIHFLLLRFMDT